MLLLVYSIYIFFDYYLDSTFREAGTLCVYQKAERGRHMVNLIKIQEVSTKYDITARTLRYYEDMGLLCSSRGDGYAYRMYDETAIKRLEQILILRKLNISVKDIQRIFIASGSDVVLEILGKKVKDIDDEAALLHELKAIVVEFIREIEQIDFNNSSNIKSLYSKAKDIETHIVNIDYIGKPSNVGRLVEVAEKLEKKVDIRIVELPSCRMVTSDVKNGDNHQRFEKMWSKLDKKRKDRFFPRDFMWHDEGTGKMVWWYAIEDWVTEVDTAGFEIIDFAGGLYATMIVPDFEYSAALRAYNSLNAWIAEHDNFGLDERQGHKALWHVTRPDTRKLLGYRQVEYFFAIRVIK